jgi:amino acid adenylation domain-containing protein
MTTVDTLVRITEVDYDPFATSTFARSFPTTDAQREIWLACELGQEASLAYNESISLLMRGPLKAAVLQAALQALTDRHEALRATFDTEGGNMLIAAQIKLTMDVIDVSGAEAAIRDARVASLRAEAVETPFDLLNGPLFRAVLVRTATDAHELIVTAHHIVCDGWSSGIISRDLMLLYKRLSAGQTAAEMPPADSFGDYALLSLEPEQSRACDADEQYWVSVFDRGQPVLDLPTDRPRGRQRTFTSRRTDYVVPPLLIGAVRKLGAQHGVSLFATLFGVFAALLERLGGNGEVVLGVPAAGQSTRGLDALVGHCVNLLPVRVTADRNDSVGKLLQHAGGRILDAYEHQNSTFGQLLTKLNVPREASRLPLVSALFNIDTPVSTAALSLDSMVVSLRSNPRAFENFELFVNASQTDNGVVLECQYHSELFDAETVLRWLALYQCALERAVADPCRPLRELFSAAPDDVERLRALSPAPQSYPRDDRLEALVARQSARTPDATAVVNGSESLTYRELEERSNAVAQALLARGTGPGHLVGMACGRNVHMLTAMLGILKAGAAYVPLDPSFPEERLAYMCTDAEIRCIVADRSVRAGGWQSIDLLFADELTPTVKSVPAVADPMAAAYVIYTSGSTGKPKGVVVHHQAVVNFLTSMMREPGLSASDRLVAVTTTSFDIAVLELFLPLTVGAQIILADRDTVLDGTALRNLIEHHSATAMQATPAGWRLLVDAGWSGSEGFKVLVGGEALPDDLAQELVKRSGAVWNMYGPTETTVWSTCWQLPLVRNGIRIGRPIANTEVLVLDGSLNHCPIGVPGEIFIGGDGVAMGYWRRPELTAERFMIFDGGRVYRTGDRGRWRNDGTLEHLGRLDFQVKVRGYRIELGEIEANLLKHKDIERAVVLVREDEPGDVRLVAYVVPAAARTIDPEAMRTFLRAGLPEYMVPAHVVALPAIPLLPNGKIDRKALPRPAMETRAGVAGAAPTTATEVVVVQVMEDVLKLRGLGIDDDFFAVGGHSLLAARLTARLNKVFELTMPLRTVFEHTSAKSLSRAIDASKGAGQVAVTRLLAQANQSEGPLTAMQERIRFMEQLYPGRVVYNTPSAHRLKGAFDIKVFNSAFQKMVQRQASLRTYIEMGPNGSHQRVTTLKPIDIPFEDLSAAEGPARETLLLQRMQDVIDRPIDIHVAPLFRVALYRLAPEEHAFLFMPHHIIWDGWSFDLLYEEMSELYSAALSRRAADLPSLTISYLDYAHWHREWTEGEDCKAQVNYWCRRFADLEPPRALPTDRPRRAGMTGEGRTEYLHFDKALTKRLRQVAMEHGATLNMLMMAIFAIPMQQATSGNSLVIGVPVRGRLIAEVEPLMGFFNNLLPTPLAVRPELQIKEWLSVVKTELIGAFAHQDVPFERLAIEPEFAKHGSRSGLYQTLFSFQDARERQRRWGQLDQSMILIMQKGATEDFGFWLVEVPDGLEGGINYNADLYDKQTACIFRDRIFGLFKRVAENPAQTIASLVSASGSDADAFAAWIKSRPSEDSESSVRTKPATAAATTGTWHPLAEIWAQLLGIESTDIDPDDNFFDLGGTSLLVMRAVEQSGQQLGVNIDPRRYVNETLRQIAASSQTEPAKLQSEPATADVASR